MKRKKQTLAAGAVAATMTAATLTGAVINTSNITIWTPPGIKRDDVAAVGKDPELTAPKLAALLKQAGVSGGILTGNQLTLVSDAYHPSKQHQGYCVIGMMTIDDVDTLGAVRAAFQKESHQVRGTQGRYFELKTAA